MEILHLEQRLAGLGALLVDAQQHFAAHHELRELLLSGAFAGQRLDHLAAPEDRHPVGDLQHLVQLVADEDDGHALTGERAEDPEQLERLLRRQHRGRLVEDQDLRAAEEGLEDLDPLLLADADVLDPGVRIDRELERPRDLLDAFLGGVLVEKDPVARRFDAEHDVLCDGHHRDQHEVLVDHSDPDVDRVARRAHGDRLALDEDLALVGLVEAVEDVHQGRLAGAVLAEERVHLAAAQVEVDAVVRDDAREALRDALQLENSRFVGHVVAIVRGRTVARPLTRPSYLSVAGGSIEPSFRPCSALATASLIFCETSPWNGASSFASGSCSTPNDWFVPPLKLPLTYWSMTEKTESVSGLSALVMTHGP